MLNQLIFASAIALGLSSSVADARRIPTPVVQSQIVFSIDQRLKAGVEMNEFHFELRADGTWSYVETKKQSIQKRAKGTLSRGQTQKIRTLLRTSWTVSRADITCMAFAAVFQEYSVNGKVVWTDEMCSGMSLDRTSEKRLAQVMAIVNPLIAKAK